MELELFCESCKVTTKHDFQASINNDVLTTISVCKDCGNTNVDSGPIDEKDIEMDCLVCDLCKEQKCVDCCRDWDNEDEE